MPDWLIPFFTFFPVYAWFFLGVGLPWSLAILPRHEWRNRPTVLALGLALGPLFSTTWLFILGTWGTFTTENAVTGTVLISVVGIAAAWLRRYRGYRHSHERPEPWTTVEKTLVVMLVLAFLVNVWITMFWTFTQYDTLWTFGKNARVFVTFHEIPDWIGYYPQLVPLTYTFGQLVNGDINDHVARAAVPWFIFASIMMAYLMGTRVWGKRSIGILTAALWMMIPSALQWSGAGDLEHPIAIYFTGAVVFFIMAWRSHQRRYAIISGLLFSGAVWTKPTGGAFAIGVLLVVGLAGMRFLISENIRQRFGLPVPNTDFRRFFQQKFTVALITGLVSLPIGLMWYIRNWRLDYEPVTFPADYWHDFAQRSGQEFGWLILISILAVAMVCNQLWGQRHNPLVRRRILLLIVGLTLFLLGTLPNALVLSTKWTSRSLWEWANGARTQDNGLSPFEVLLVVSGLGLLVWQLYPSWQKMTDRARSSAILGTLLILPFTVVWFWNFSYHARLVLTITPVLASMVAALIDAWLIPFMSKNALRRRTLLFLTVWLCVPALVIGSWFTLHHTFIVPLHTDAEKYTASNPALMEAVDVIQQEIDARPNRDYVIVQTLDETRLQFFFPNQTTFWDGLLNDLDEIYPNADLLIGGTHADFLWQKTAYYPTQISAYMDMGIQYTRPYLEYGNGQIMRMPLTPISLIDDGNNRFFIFEYYLPYRKYTIEDIKPPLTFEDAQWDFIALRGIDIREVVPNDSEPIQPNPDGTITINGGESIYLQLYWQRTSETPIPVDYSVFVHLVNAETGEIESQRDGALVNGVLPMTLVPYPDLIADRREWTIPTDIPAGTYDLHIGIYNPADPSLARIPVTGGVFEGEDGIWIRERIQIKQG